MARIQKNLRIQEDLQAIYAGQEAEEKEIEDIILAVHSTINKLKKEEIINATLLKKKLEAIKNKKYRDLVYALFRLSIMNAPKGSFITLNVNKVLKLLS